MKRGMAVLCSVFCLWAPLKVGIPSVVFSCHNQSGRFCQQLFFYGQLLQASELFNVFVAIMAVDDGTENLLNNRCTIWPNAILPLFKVCPLGCSLLGIITIGSVVLSFC